MYCATESGKIKVNGEILRDFNEIESEHFYELEEFLLSLFYN
jgi:hypothetical protein